MAGPATIEAPPRPEAQTNGAPVPARPAKKRMLIIVNPYATTVSDRLKNLVVYALQGRYQVEAVPTDAQNHATEIGREAVPGRPDVVVAFGGPGYLSMAMPEGGTAYTRAGNLLLLDDGRLARPHRRHHGNSEEDQCDRTMHSTNRGQQTRQGAQCDLDDGADQDDHCPPDALRNLREERDDEQDEAKQGDDHHPVDPVEHEADDSREVQGIALHGRLVQDAPVIDPHAQTKEGEGYCGGLDRDLGSDQVGKNAVGRSHGSSKLGDSLRRE